MQVSNRHTFADSQLYQQLAPELLALYRRPLHVQGWDVALIEVLSARLRWSCLPLECLICL